MSIIGHGETIVQWFVRLRHQTAEGRDRDTGHWPCAKEIHLASRGMIFRGEFRVRHTYLGGAVPALQSQDPVSRRPGERLFVAAAALYHSIGLAQKADVRESLIGFAQADRRGAGAGWGVKWSTES